MKKIGLVLIGLLFCFLIKFFYENLNDGSFFLKIGCINESKEYSLFLESGCKNSELSTHSIRLPTAQNFSVPPTISRIEGVSLNDFNQIGKPVKAISATFLTDEDEEQREFAITLAELEMKKIELSTGLGEASLIQEITVIECEEFKEIDFESETAFAEASVQMAEGILPEQVDLSSMMIADFEAEESAEFEMVAVYSELQEVEILPIICSAHPEIEQTISEFEVAGFDEIPNTERELAAADLDAIKIESSLFPTAFFEEPKGAETPMGFGDAAIAGGVEPYVEFPVQASEVAGRGVHGEIELAILEFEVVGFAEIPNTERELAAADLDAIKIESSLFPTAFFEEPKGAETPMLFGDAAIAGGVEPYLELPGHESSVAGSGVEAGAEWFVLDFEVGGYKEEPNVERELAAAELDVRGSEVEAEIAIGKIEEPKGAEIPMLFGDAAIAGGVEPYLEWSGLEPRIAGSGVEAGAEWFVLDFEVGGYKEEPNVERELAAAELDVRGSEVEAEIAIGKIEEPKGAEIPMLFGDAAIAGGVEPYLEWSGLEPRIAGSGVEAGAEWFVSDFEVGGYKEEPNVERELAAAELDVRGAEVKSEIVIGKIEEPKGADTPMLFGDAAIAEGVEPYLELPGHESNAADSGVEAGAEWFVSEFEVGGYKEEPNIERELAAAELDVRGSEVEAEIAIGKIEEPKGAETPMLFGDAAIAGGVEPYLELPGHELNAAGSGVEAGAEWFVSEFEVGGYKEEPNIERELAAAELDLRQVKAEAPIGKIEEPKGAETPMLFGDVAIAEGVEPYLELPVRESEVAGSRIETGAEWLVSDFEVGGYKEEPNVERELAAAELDARGSDAEVPIVIGKIEEPKGAETPMAFADVAIRDGVEPYVELPVQGVGVEIAAGDVEPTISEAPIGKIEEPKGAEIPIAVVDKGEPCAEPVKLAAVAEECPKAPSEPTYEMPSWFKQWLQSYKQSPPEVEEYTDVVCCDDWNWFPGPKWISIRHTWGEQEKDCIPFATNYTTLEILFAPDYRLGKVMPMLDLRGHRFDNNTYAANAGIGGRYIPDPCCDCFCEILGFNGYYDFRQGCIGYYQQVGVGLEILGRRWDLRANAYAPFGNKRHIRTCVFDDYDGDYYAIRDSIESISYSFNAEFGFLVFETCNNFSLYAAAGPYFLARALCNDGVVGAEARLRPQYKDYIALDLSWRYDRLFETIWQVEIVLNLPLYQISCRNKYPCGISDRQIYQPIERFEVMPLSKRTCWYTNF